MDQNLFASNMITAIQNRFESKRSYLAYIMNYLDTGELSLISEKDVLSYLERFISRLYYFDQSCTLNSSESSSVSSGDLEKELNKYLETLMEK